MPACLALAELTHWAWLLALLPEPGAQSPEPRTHWPQPSSPSPSSAPTLPSIPQYTVHGEDGVLGNLNTPIIGQRCLLGMLLKQWLVGQEEKGIKGNEYIDKNKNTQ